MEETHVSAVAEAEPTKPKRTRTKSNAAKATHRRITLIFTGKYAPLYEAIHKLAADDDREVGAFLVRTLNDTYISTHTTDPKPEN